MAHIIITARIRWWFDYGNKTTAQDRGNGVVGTDHYRDGYVHRPVYYS